MLFRSNTRSATPRRATTSLLTRLREAPLAILSTAPPIHLTEDLDRKQWTRCPLHASLSPPPGRVRPPGALLTVYPWEQPRRRLEAQRFSAPAAPLCSRLSSLFPRQLQPRRNARGLPPLTSSVPGPPLNPCSIPPLISSSALSLPFSSSLLPSPLHSSVY